MNLKMKILKNGLILAIIIYVGMLLMLLMVRTTYQNGEKYDYLIIPGALVKADQTPDLMLKQRLDQALEIIKEQPETMQIIVSGGQGEDEPISEAEAMKNYLVTNGIPVSRIILEPKATSTFENIKFSQELVNGKAVIVSQQFHQFRIQFLLSRMNLDWDRAVAKNDYFLPLSPFYREPFAIVKTILFDK